MPAAKSLTIERVGGDAVEDEADRRRDEVVDGARP